MEFEIAVNTESSKPRAQPISEQLSVEDMEEPEIARYQAPIPKALSVPVKALRTEQKVSIAKKQLSDNMPSITTRSATTNSMLSGVTGKVAQTGSPRGQSGTKSQSSQSLGGDGHAISAYWSSVSHAISRNLRYPLSARNRGLEGVVKLKLTINAQGKLVNVSSDTSLADDSLRDAAVRAVYQTAPFPPPVTKNNTDGHLTAELPVRFELVKGKGQEEKI
ncbi:MAG: TonB family protein [Kiritimatiellae bacterium]|nr:TonB family protein [Kiritimatiellia bacterium]MDD5519763.1 TonB family protein [Kiritimatiellia bacterium]